jgi:hypothetical protein
VSESRAGALVAERIPGIVAVATRAELRGPRFLLPAVRSTLGVERILSREPHCLRYRALIGSSTELWSFTVWDDVRAMKDFAIGADHGARVWKRTSWLKSYWGLRLVPGGRESGTWDGETFVGEPPARAAQQASVALSAESADRPDDAAGVHLRYEVVARVPSLRAAFGGGEGVDRTAPAGASTTARSLRGAVVWTYRVRAGLVRCVPALRDAVRLRNAARSDRGAFAATAGIGRGGDVLLLIVWRDGETARAFAGGPLHRRFLARWGRRAWWMSWAPEQELGRWGGRKLGWGTLSDAAGTRVRLPGGDRRAAEARRIIGSLDGFLDAERISTVSLLVTEALRAAGTSPGPLFRGPVDLTTTLDRGWLRVALQWPDGAAGAGADSRTGGVATPGASESDDWRWAAYLADELTDRWGTTDRPPGLWFELRTARPAPSAA